MHHYQHNIKTFNHATRHLTRVERALYRDLIELYYDTEQPLPAVSFDKLCRLVLAHSDDEKTALKAVLDEFFVLTGEVYSHDYCDEQIEKYRANSSIKSKAGKASAEARKAKSEQRKASRKQTLNTCSTDVQLTSNHKPITNNQVKDIVPANAVTKPATGTRLDPEWQLPKELGNWALEQGLNKQQVILEGEKFRDHWIAQAGAKGRKADWPATWRNWIRNSKTRQPQTFYQITKEQKERDADKRLTAIGNATMAELEEAGLARNGVILGGSTNG